MVRGAFPKGNVQKHRSQKSPHFLLLQKLGENPPTPVAEFVCDRQKVGFPPQPAPCTLLSMIKFYSVHLLLRGGKLKK